MDKPSDQGLPEPSDPTSEGDGPALGEVSVRRIQIVNLCLLAVTAIGSFKFSQPFALGVVAGGALMAGNFGIIVSVIKAVFLGGEASALKVGLYWFKFAAVMLIAGTLILVFRVDVIGLLVGLSMILVAIVAEALVRLAKS